VSTPEPGSRSGAPEPLRVRASAFLDHLDDWLASRPEITLAAAGSALVVVDLVHGFVDEGPLASPRVARLVPVVAECVRGFADGGGRWLCVVEDAHPADAPEFRAFPPHCLAGTRASRTVEPVAAAAERAGLDTTWIRKATITPRDAGLLDWAAGASAALGPRPAIAVAGDATDLCLYQTAMGLLLWANRPEIARELGPVRVVVGLDAVDTYDLAAADARSSGALPHDGDLHHAMFAHHLALNGVEVAQHVAWR